MGNTFLFLLCPPLSGTTVIQELIMRSRNVSVFPHPTQPQLGAEGQMLDGAFQIFKGPWPDLDADIDWDVIKRVFMSHWDLSKKVLFDKSPPLLMRADELAKQFKPSAFLISIRNPYAMIEGFLRRGWMKSPEQAANLWVNRARLQVRNLETLERKLFFTYETFAGKTDECLERIAEFMPELDDLNPDMVFSSHNVLGRPLEGIHDLNHIKITNLRMMGGIGPANTVLGQDKELLDYFDYQLLPD